MTEPEIIRLNILRGYAVSWDARTLVRDFVQNFFDSTDDFEGIAIVVDRKTKSVRISGPAEFDLDYLRFVGATTKAGGGFAGQFGEGFKIAVLVALRDFDLRIVAGSKDWRIEPAFEEVRLGDGVEQELVYRYRMDEGSGGSFLELKNCTKSILDHFARVAEAFECRANPHLGERLFTVRGVRLYRAASGKGAVYLAKQRRGSVVLPFAFCLDALPEIPRDRDRRDLRPKHVTMIVKEVARRMPFALGMQVLLELEHQWTATTRPIRALIAGILNARRREGNAAKGPAFPDSWVAGETGTWSHANAYAKRIGKKVAKVPLHGLGMKRARTLLTEGPQVVADASLTSTQRLRRSVLQRAVIRIAPGEAMPIKFVVLGAAEARLLIDHVVCDVQLLDGDFGTAVSAVARAIAHVRHHEGDGRYSDELTDFMQQTIAARDDIGVMAEEWKVAGTGRL